MSIGNARPGRPFFGPPLSQNILHDFAAYIRQPEIATGIAIRQLLMIEAEQREHGCVQVVDVNRVFSRAEAKFIGRAMDMPAFYAATSQPHREAIMIVVAAFAFARRS